MSNALKHIPLSQIRFNPVALRTVNKETEKYQGLVESVKRVGILNAINVREISNEPGNEVYGLSDGLHRFSAAQDAGLASIPAQVMNLTDAEVLEAQIIANIHKIETTPAEYSKQLSRMIASNPALTGPEVAARLGMSTTWLNDRLGLQKLTDDIQRIVDDGKITVTNAIGLSKLPVELQPEYLERAMTQSPGEFCPAAQKARRAYDEAKRQGRDPNADDFLHIPKLQKIAVINDERSSPLIGPALIAKHQPASLAAAFALALDWVMNCDVDSVAAQRAKHEQSKKERKEAKEKAKKEREEKAKQAALATQANLQTAT